MPGEQEMFFGKGGQLRSGFGKQALGNHPTAPGADFGSSVRDATLKLYASSEHDKAKLKSSGGNQSMGAIYKVVSGHGKQALSVKHNAPCYGIGSEQRKGLAVKSGVPGPGNYKTKTSMDAQVESLKHNTSKPVFGSGTRDQREKVYQDAESEKTYFGRLSPGPCAYDSKSGMGPQVLSDKHSSQTTGLGYGTRFNYDFVRRAKEQPGAGDYAQSVACGKQQLSIKKTLPLYSFGSSNRDQAGKVYMSREHEKSQKGDCSPGPITASSVSGCGKQVLSKRKSQPRASFGTSERFGKNYYCSTVSPGPAAYAA